MFVFRRISHKYFNLHQICGRCAYTKEPLNFNEIKNPTKVPLKSITSPNQIKSETVTIDKPTLELLERLSLCNLSDKEALETLEESIEFASKIFHIDTTGVAPMHFVHEDAQLELREDKVTEGNIRDILLANAPVTDDTCFIAPPGNIPVELEEKAFSISKTN